MHTDGHSAHCTFARVCCANVKMHFFARYYHPLYTAVLGAVLCALVMLFMSWWATILVLIVYVVFAVFLEVKSGAEIWYGCNAGIIRVAVCNTTASKTNKSCRGHGIKGAQTFIALRMLQDQEYKAYLPTEPTLGDMSMDDEPRQVHRTIPAPRASHTQPPDLIHRFMQGAEGVRVADPSVRLPVRQRPWSPQVLGMCCGTFAVRTMVYSHYPFTLCSVCRPKRNARQVSSAAPHDRE